ncbi:MAG: spore germination protein, partial [Bacteroidota bacterium]
AISIVGALVVGEAAVRAGLVGAPMIIVVALTAIASFVVPPQQDVGTILRVGLTILAGILGAPGLAFGLLLTLVHLAALRSFGAPYLAPLAPFKAADLKDVAVRAPWWFMLSRPSFIRQLDPERQRFRLPAAVDKDGQAEK